MNHNGNIDLCNELIRQAKSSGASIAKIQLGWRSQPGEINHITGSDLQKIFNYSSFVGIDLMASIITEEAFKLAVQFPFKYYKVASRTTLNDDHLTKQIIELGLPTFISHGMSKTLDKSFRSLPNVFNLWCKSSYPAYIDDLLSADIQFPQRFGHHQDFIGYSDHCLGLSACFVALARGAQIIEKHFTLDKSDTHIRDHALSATPVEFSHLVSYGREIHSLSSHINSM